MVRGRATARGTRRGTATAGQRPQAQTGEASTSAAPAATGSTSSTRDGTSTPARGSAATRATRGPTASRFRPKVVRRDEAERDNLARQEEKKAQERAADEKRARGRSRFRSKRSRGNAMGTRGGFGGIISGASGPFSSGFAGGSGWGSGGGGSFGGSGGFGGGSFPRSGFKSESKPGFNQRDGSRYREARINADKLNAQTPQEELDSEDEAMMVALSSKPTTVLPMGIYRKEHKNEEIVVATTAELEAAENDNNEEESLWVDGDESAPQTLSDQSEEGGVWDTNGDQPIAIKKEPEHEGSMDLDIETKPASEEPDKQEEKKPIVQTQPQSKPKKAATQESEEKMIQADLNLLVGELGTVTISDEGEDGEEKKVEDVNNKDGRLYLFQFPPILPPLKQISQPKPTSKVKPEPEDSNMLDSTPAVENAPPVDLTQEDGMEDDEDDENQEDPEETAGFLSQLSKQGGLVGQLKVRKSGRVELDWGGQILEMSPAAGMNFLTTAVIVEENDEKPRPGVQGGESIGMGKIMGRFVLAPTWEEEEDWDVSAEELRVD